MCTVKYHQWNESKVSLDGIENVTYFKKTSVSIDVWKIEPSYTYGGDVI